MSILNEYEIQANEFLKSTGTKYKCVFLKHDYHFTGDKETRDIYRITLTRNGKSASFKFGQSIHNSERGAWPKPYDLLAAIQKYEPGTLKYFCSEFGYDTDSIKANKIYKDVVKEFAKVQKLFSQEEIELLQEIN